MGRYQSHTLLHDERGVRTSLGIDQLTGLPVLVYRFAGKPTAAAGDLSSDNIPGILASSLEGQRGRLVVAYSRDYQPVTPPLEGDALNLLLLDSARALRDAAKAGVVHGDLKPKRFLGAGEHHLIEGYGVRWPAVSGDFALPEGGSSYAGDVFAWAKSVLHLSSDHLPEALHPLARTCLAADPQARPVAEDIYREIKGYVFAHKPRPEARPLSPFDTLEIELTDGAQSWPEPTPASPTAEAKTAEAKGEPLLVHTDPKQHAEAQPASTSPAGTYGLEVTGLLVPKRSPIKSSGFVKSLPPGATYHSGQPSGPPPAPPSLHVNAPEEVQPKRRYLLWLLLFILGAAILAYLALWYQGRGTPSATSTSASPSTYFIDVKVAPADLRHVALLVITSPNGSARHPGDELSPVPGEVALDHKGAWELRGRFGNRLSRIVSVQVPEQRKVTLHFPATPLPLLPPR